MKIIFMGTPDFSVGTLEALVEAGHEVVLAVTQPDKPKGRGKEMQFTPVKECALAHNIPVYQPKKIREPECIEELKKYQADVCVVVAFGQILPKEILEMTLYGCINVHASLLPKYRGAAPIQWAVINGEKVSGVTTMQMDEGLDTGDMLLKAETEIGEYETAEELFDRLAVIGGDLLLKTIDGLEKGSITPTPQNDKEHTYAPMISRETGVIDWSKSAREISKLICGMNSWPLACTKYKDGILKIVSARVCDENSDKEAGEILALEKGKGLKISCGEGTLYIVTAQFPNSKKMNVEDYARGHEIELGVVLGKE